MSNKSIQLYVRLPILLGLALASGIFIGAKMFSRSAEGLDKNIVKLKDVLTYIDKFYVDSVNSDEITEHAIREMLEKLDPHTSYIPAKDLAQVNEQLEGNFEGIGIEFNIFKDTICVVTPLAGGPAEEVGLQSGDKIVKVNGENVTGKKINTQDVFKHLKGKGGTKVKVSILRKNTPKPLDFTITRGKIPIHTVDAGYMIDSKTGYIKVNRFGAKTYEEFKESLEKLTRQGMTQLVLDLRDNPGGYMGAAIKIADELIVANRKIVYTRGKEERFDEEAESKDDGIFEKGAVVTLINEGSASASEIVAGALQDNDRALIVGRRSYGKGLVQKPIDLIDGSELRLTISRYYTPSGRSIQKPYEKGNHEEYEQDYYNRVQHGELYNPDSSILDEKKVYKTRNGRKVYGGGGIMPDYFVARDTSYYSAYLNSLYGANVIREYALNYANDHRKKLQAMTLSQFEKQFEVTDAMLAEVVKMGEESKVKANETDLEKSKKFLKNQIKALIAKTFWQNEGLFKILESDDEVLQKALQVFGEAQKLEAGTVSENR